MLFSYNFFFRHTSRKSYKQHGVIKVFRFMLLFHFVFVFWLATHYNTTTASSANIISPEEERLCLMCECDEWVLWLIAGGMMMMLLYASLLKPSLACVLTRGKMLTTKKNWHMQCTICPNSWMKHTTKTKHVHTHTHFEDTWIKLCARIWKYGAH